MFSSQPVPPAAGAAPDRLDAAVVVTRIDGTVLGWSAQAERLFEIPMTRAIGRRLDELIQRDRGTVERRALAEVGAGGVLVQQQRVTTATGRQVAVRSTTTVANGPDGARELIISASAVPASAIGLQRTAGADRTATAGRFGGGSAVELGVELSMFCDESAVVTYVSPSLAALFGAVPRNVIGRDARSGIHLEDQAAWQSAWDEVTAEPGATRTVEVRIRHVLGFVRWIEHTMLNRLDDPQVHGVVIAARDVTDLHELADVLAASEQTLLAVLEASTEGVWIIDPAGFTLYSNAIMADVLGLSNEALAAGISQLDDPELLRTLHDENSAHLPGVHSKHEIVYTRPDGRRVWLRLAVTPRFDLRGQFSGNIVMCSQASDQERSLSSGSLSRLLVPLGPEGALNDQPRRGEPLPLREPLATSSPTSVLEPAGFVGARFAGEQIIREALAPLRATLSRREFDVVVRLLVGDRAPAIALRLHVSQSTVRNQLSSAFRKLEVNSQQDLIDLIRVRYLTGQPH